MIEDLPKQCRVGGGGRWRSRIPNYGVWHTLYATKLGFMLPTGTGIPTRGVGCGRNGCQAKETEHKEYE